MLQEKYMYIQFQVEMLYYVKFVVGVNREELQLGLRRMTKVDRRTLDLFVFQYDPTITEERCSHVIVFVFALQFT